MLLSSLHGLGAATSSAGEDELKKYEAKLIQLAMGSSGLLDKALGPQTYSPQDPKNPINAANNWLNLKGPDGKTNSERVAAAEMVMLASLAKVSGIGAPLAAVIPVYFNGMKTMEDIVHKYVGEGAARIVRAMTLTGVVGMGVPGALVQAANEAVAEYGVGGALILGQAALWAVTVPVMGAIIGGAVAATYLIFNKLLGGESDEEKRTRRYNETLALATRMLCEIQPERCQKVSLGYTTINLAVGIPPDQIIGWAGRIVEAYCKENAYECSLFPGDVYQQAHLTFHNPDMVIAWAKNKRQQLIKRTLDNFVIATRNYQARIDEMVRASNVQTAVKAVGVGSAGTLGAVILALLLLSD